MSDLTSPVGWKLVHPDRSYNQRIEAILRFNTAKNQGADLDDCLDAAWKGMLATSYAPAQESEGGTA